jgi:hypothetical protein
VLASDGSNVTAEPVRRHIDNAMVKAIARAFRWRDMLEGGECATIREIAAVEKINESYIGRALRLTLLAPDIVEAILAGRQPAVGDAGGTDATVCRGVDGAAKDDFLLEECYFR